ncbi:serine hydrolase domain-containing protein [Bosea vestrisii]|uniref:serine hydrolase domain-containing protein n=1 Tax=Bosea vestrisii TaxID=151416 RepID=UPI0024E02C85|nr:serine hydrolase domain-containing protein [Bosea vestrisii]WID98515.1 serine hydrolase domain-containing protein [Bosea vestrisii]
MKRFIGAALLFGIAALSGVTKAEAQQPAQAAIEALLPEFEKQVAEGMKAFSVPGVAVGIVHDDKLIYTKGFGVRELGKPEQVTPETIFQIGSTTKAFLATTLAQAVDAGRLGWSDPVIDHVPEFQLADPWVTRDFRVLDLAAQRSGLTAYVNDALTMLGYDKQTLIRSLRAAPQLGLFRSDFRYLNIPHVVGGEIIAKVNAAPSWFDSLQKTLLAPLGMNATTATAEAITAAPNHAQGHRLADKPVAVPFHPSFPYALGPAGALNSNIPDMAKWLRLQLGRGQFEGKILVSEANLDITWMPRVAMNERTSYAVGWVATATPRGRIIWHNGGTAGFGAHAGFLPDARTGIVILTNLENGGMPDALAMWFYDRVLGNPAVDNIALAAASAKGRREAAQAEAAGFVPGRLSPIAAAFAGSYASPILGDATVALTEGKLNLTLEKTEAQILLEPNRDDPYLFQARLAPTGAFVAPAEMSGGEPLTRLRFETDAAGKIGQMRWLSPELPHSFARAAQ